MNCPMPVFCTWPNSFTPRPATTCAEPSTSRSYFFGDHGLASWVAVQGASPTRTVWRFHVPRIWIRSINLCTMAVKRKSQNLANFFRTRLYLVVLFRESPSAPLRNSSLNSLHAILYETISFFAVCRVFLTLAHQLATQETKTQSVSKKNAPFAEKIRINGVNNAGKIKDHLFRGAQPDGDGRCTDWASLPSSIYAVNLAIRARAKNSRQKASE